MILVTSKILEIRKKLRSLIITKKNPCRNILWLTQYCIQPPIHRIVTPLFSDFHGFRPTTYEMLKSFAIFNDIKDEEPH